MLQKQISISQEDYLEAILRIFNEKKGVRTKDIAAKLNVRNSSVTSALKHLAKEGLVHYEKYGTISLTDEGEEIANNIWIRHQTMYFFFHDILEMSDTESKAIACEMEHAITETAFTKFLHYLYTNHPKKLENYIATHEINLQYLTHFCEECVERK